MKAKITTVTLIILFQWSYVQKEHKKEVLFKVNMNQVGNVKSVGLRAQFTSPPWEVTIPMSDENNDGIYEVSVTETTAQDQAEFKFIKNNDEFELNDKPNRMIHFDYKPEKMVYQADFNNK